jgi:integrase
MQTVQPIRDINQIHRIESILKSHNTRDYILFELGIYSGLRISDILKLKVKDIRNQEYFILKEDKTGKDKKLKIQPKLKTELDSYTKNMKDEDYLIPSQKYRTNVIVTKRINNKNIKEIIPNISDNSPISRNQAWEILNNVAKKVGIKEEIGCHSMRKTFGYHFYMQYNDTNNRALVILQQIFNHSTPHTTLRYIGIVQDEIDNMIDSFVM